MKKHRKSGFDCSRYVLETVDDCTTTPTSRGHIITHKYGRGSSEKWLTAAKSKRQHAVTKSAPGHYKRMTSTKMTHAITVNMSGDDREYFFEAIFEFYNSRMSFSIFARKS